MTDMTDMVFLSFEPNAEKKTKTLAHARRYVHSVEKTARWEGINTSELEKDINIYCQSYFFQIQYFPQDKQRKMQMAGNTWRSACQHIAGSTFV